MNRTLVALQAGLALLLSSGGALAQDEPPDTGEGVGVRGGFSVNVGFTMPTQTAVFGPTATLGLRIGVQINRFFSVYYQNSPTISFFFTEDNGIWADDNSILANLTLFKRFEFAAGPSFDLVGEYACPGGCGSGVNPAFGLHGRFALNFGDFEENGPHGGGFTLGFDGHPSFYAGTSLITVTLGLGGEWY